MQSSQWLTQQVYWYLRVDGILETNQHFVSDSPKLMCERTLDSVKHKLQKKCQKHSHCFDVYYTQNELIQTTKVISLSFIMLFYPFIYHFLHILDEIN